MLESEDDPDFQVERAVGAFSPFGVRQLFFGSTRTGTDRVTLLYFGHRKNFEGQDDPMWTSAEGVYPAFLAWCAAAPDVPTILIHDDCVSLTAIAWNGSSPMPAAIISRKASSGTEEELLAEITRRMKLEKPQIRREAGSLNAALNVKSQSVTWSIRRPEASYPEFLGETSLEDLRFADIRDRAAMLELRRERRHSFWVTRAMSVALALLVGAGILDLASFLRSSWISRKERQLKQQSEVVTRIQSEQAISERLEQLTAHRLKLYQVLTLLNDHRPEGIEFIRLVTGGPYSVEVNAQTKNADEVRQSRGKPASDDLFRRT